jgi:hypothetical protein
MMEALDKLLYSIFFFVIVFFLMLCALECIICIYSQSKEEEEEEEEEKKRRREFDLNFMFVQCFLRRKRRSFCFADRYGGIT